MTFLELLNRLNKIYGKENEDIFYEIFSFLSLKYKTKNDVILSLRKEIDFSEVDVFKICEKYFIEKVPIEHITNKSYFMGMQLFVNNKVLIPRKETEYLTSLIIDKYRYSNNINVLDLCCGSGAIGLSIKKYLPNSNVTLLDKYSNPIKISKLNANLQNIDVRVIKKDLRKKLMLHGKFDLIISNPPYVKKRYKLDDYVKKEPKKALFANDNGMSLIKIIIDRYYGLLNNHGELYIEFGFDQKNLIEEYVKDKYNYSFISDQFNIFRFLRIIKE